MELQHFKLDRSGPVWVAAVDRPDAKNAVSRQTFEEMDRLLEEAGSAAGCRALVLTATGGDFIAGGDVKEGAGFTERAHVADWSTRAKQVLGRIRRLRIPVIAAVEGHAVGGGCEVALACDMRVAGTGARFSFWEIKMAVTSGWGGGRRLLDLVGRAGALELLLSGQTLGADRALAMGLINQVVPDGEAVKAAVQLGERIAANSPTAVSAMKELIYGLDGLTESEADALETDLFSETWLSPDHAEAVRAFLERRKPKW